MPYELRLKRSVIKDLRRIGRKAAEEIMATIRRILLADPRGAGRPLKGHDGILWRFRSGDYRVIYAFDDDTLIVLVVRVGGRKDVYKNLYSIRVK